MGTNHSSKKGDEQASSRSPLCEKKNILLIGYQKIGQLVTDTVFLNVRLFKILYYVLGI